MAHVDPMIALAKFVKQYPLRKDAAAKLGISAQYLTDITSGHRPIPDRVLERLGLRRVTRFERVSKRKAAA